MTRIRWTARWLALLGALCALALPARADLLFSLDRDRVQAELERTEQVLSRATTTLRDCTSIKGRALLEDALRMQEKAWDVFRGARPPGESRELAIAERFTIEARKRGVDAIETCQVEFRAQETLRTMLDSTRDMVQEARELVSRGNDAEARRLLDAGIWQLDKASEAYRSREFRKAISLGGAARILVQRAMQQARGARPEIERARVEVHLERTDALLNEVRRAVAGRDTKVAALLTKAEREQDQARTLFRDDHFQAALRRTQAARSTALDALWLVQSSPEAAQVRSAIEMVERLLEVSGPEIRASDSEEGSRLLEAAEAQLAAAREGLEDGDTARAAQAARAADSLLRRALEAAEGDR